ncbi:hypothetical protein V1478_017633 [Vespula squamosa]|uniref:Secreted protein n=1 Tax=Vespula squamosa TaxID=30214 RepID=A0ABD1ZWF0_VESSQ
MKTFRIKLRVFLHSWLFGQPMKHFIAVASKIIHDHWAKVFKKKEKRKIIRNITIILKCLHAKSIPKGLRETCVTES